jgi:hypothetical protein
MQFKCVNTSETKKILLCFSHQEMTAWPGCQRFNIIIGNVSTIPDEHILINDSRRKPVLENMKWYDLTMKT